MERNEQLNHYHQLHNDLTDIIAATRTRRYPSLHQPHGRPTARVANPTEPTEPEKDYATHLLTQLAQKGWRIRNASEEEK